MLAAHTPAPEKGVIRNRLIDELQEKHCYEIVTWPAYYPDEICMNMLRENTDPNVVLFIAMMKGITPIVTIGDHKSFIADFTEQKKPKRSLQSLQNPSYSSREQAEKHLRDRRDSV